MNLTKQEIKKRYYDRIYANAPIIECACGCGQKIKSKDHYGRDRRFVNGHNNRKYSDSKQYKREWDRRNRKSRRKNKAKLIARFKAELIVNAGSQCLLCGLPFDGQCTALFDFHHRNPEKKLFNVNTGALNKYSKARIREEAAKCDLLCANCHRLLHWDWKDC